MPPVRPFKEPALAKDVGQAQIVDQGGPEQYQRVEPKKRVQIPQEEMRQIRNVGFIEQLQQQRRRGSIDGVGVSESRPFGPSMDLIQKTSDAQVFAA